MRNDFESLVATWASDVRRGVDVLLTNEWCKGTTNLVPFVQCATIFCRALTPFVSDALLPKAPNGRLFDKVGADGVAMVAKALKPRSV